MNCVTRGLLRGYASLFVHCWDGYAVQQRDGSYRRARSPLSLELLAAHLMGRFTLGTYLLDAQGYCSFAVFDADGDGSLQALALLSVELAAQGIPSLLEASRRGGHLWVHLAEPTAAHMVRVWLLPYALALGIELYPKQGTLQLGGPGSLIRLPLGVHRQSGGWYPFVSLAPDGSLVPVGETVADCIAWACTQVRHVRVPDEVQASVYRVSEVQANEQSLVRGGVLASPGRFEHGSIRAWCTSEDIVSVIGRYVDLDRRGVGSCPFKEHHYRGDVRPSFQVFGGHDSHWYCFTWQRAGNLFDFLCLYHRLTPREVWERIQCGLLP